MLWTSWLLVGIYILMLLQAFFSYKRINNSKNFISTNRKTPNNSAVISTQMTSSAIPVFLILPVISTTSGGLIKGIIIAVAVTVGTVASYLLIAERMRIYSEITGDNHTVPSYISARFGDSSGWLRAFSASITTVFMVLLSAFTLSVAANIAAQTFGWTKASAAILICGASMVNLYLGGIASSIAADRVRSLIVLGTAIAIFGFIIFELIVGNNDHSSVRMIPQTIQGQSISGLNIFSCIGMIFGCFGFPTAIKRYLLIKERKPRKRFSFTALVWCLVCSAAMLFLMYIITAEPSVTEFLKEFFTEFENGKTIIIFNTVIDSLLFVSLMIVLMAITDGAILAAATTFSSDIFNLSLTHETDEKKKLLSNKVTVIIAGFAAFILSLGEEPMPIMEPSFIWATMGACFGPVILFSLYCRRLTTKGAVASITSGLLTILIWKFVLSSLGGIFMLYEIIPGFIISTVTLYAVSYLDRQKPSPRILNEFGRMTEMVKMQRK